MRNGRMLAEDKPSCLLTKYNQDVLKYHDEDFFKKSKDTLLF